MPTLEPIVVNPPKEKKTYTYSENDIVDIVAQAIKQGKIEAGAGFEEVEIKIYASDLNLTAQIPYISNTEKIAQIENLLTKFKNKKLIIGRVEAPGVRYGESDTFLTLYIQSVCSDGGNHEEDAEAINMYDGIAEYGAGFSKMAIDATTTIYITNVTIGSENTEYAQALITFLVEHPDAYIYYTFRVEK